MKKVLALALGMMLIPFTAFGMQTISEQEMDNVTGQSGVAIAIDDVKIYTHDGASEMWYATSGAVGTDTYDAYDAAVGMVWDTDSYQMMHVNAIMYEGDASNAFTVDDLYSPGRDLQGTYVADFNYSNMDTNASGVENHLVSSALTIRVDNEVPIISEAKGNMGRSGAAGVVIGLPTVEIFIEEGSSDVFEIQIATGADGDPLAGANPLNGGAGEYYSFGTIYSTDGNSTMAILDGSVEIVPLESYLTE